ncbi:MAG: sugar phosphate nucleotidyltransferase [Candidatus Roizmanbacteria bacterium]|nr:sugar phosphate nucleotidyltransferase [Candidatus Roizmanbacteria bacterium]
MKIHTVLILAGGDGDRFYPLEQKGRFRFNGKTVLQHIVESVSDLAEHTIVVTNSVNEASIKSDLSAYAVRLVTQTKDEGGMADAVIAAKQYLTKDVLILNGNDLFDFSVLKKSIEKTQKEGSLVGMVAKYMEDYFPGGYVRFEGDQAVEIIEKPSPEKKPSDYVNLVTDYMPDASLFISELEKLSPSDDQFEKAISALMSKKPATCYKYTGDWTTLKFSWHVLSMQDYFFTHFLKSNKDSSVRVHKTATIEGLVHFGKNVQIGAYSKITGPCYIGDNVTIGDHSLVRNSTVEENSLVGSGCEVARSYLAQGVMLHRNYVGDSVLSEGVSMGAGAVTANYRFDAQTVKTPIKGKMIDTKKGKCGLIAGKDVKIGVNVSTYPGIKLSPKTMVLPGEVVTKDK